MAAVILTQDSEVNSLIKNVSHQTKVLLHF